MGIAHAFLAAPYFEKQVHYRKDTLEYTLEIPPVSVFNLNNPLVLQL